MFHSPGAHPSLLASVGCGRHKRQGRRHRQADEAWEAAAAASLASFSVVLRITGSLACEQPAKAPCKFRLRAGWLLLGFISVRGDSRTGSCHTIAHSPCRHLQKGTLFPEGRRQQGFSGPVPTPAQDAAQEDPSLAHIWLKIYPFWQQIPPVSPEHKLPRSLEKGTAIALIQPRWVPKKSWSSQTL